MPVTHRAEWSAGNGSRSVTIEADVRIAPPSFRHAFLCRYTYKLFGSGDLVLIMETRPLSRQKRWRLVEIVEKAK